MTTVEVWKSSENQEEVHVFNRQGVEYVIGFNPKIFSWSRIAELLKEVGVEMPCE
jgi:hypothetical protein